MLMSNHGLFFCKEVYRRSRKGYIVPLVTLSGRSQGSRTLAGVSEEETMK